MRSRQYVREASSFWRAPVRKDWGEAVFEQWMLEAEDLDSILKRIQRDFQIGGHKAASFARALKRARIFLVSGIDRNWCAIFHGAF